MSNSTSPVVRLDCCCCGNGTYGRQWHNRDDGWGMCNSCIEDMRTRGCPEEEITKLCGEIGIHRELKREDITKNDNTPDNPKI